ncbi:MAG: RimK-like ATPgrasp N-terminal domain-containing protein [Burkholderiales bacterium]
MSAPEPAQLARADPGPALVIVPRRRDFPWTLPGIRVTSAHRYLAGEAELRGRRAAVINLCRFDRYQGRGYYVSLLAEARGHAPLPAMRVLGDVRRGVPAALAHDEFCARLQLHLSGRRAPLFALDVVLGRDARRAHDALAADASVRLPAAVQRLLDVGGHRARGVDGLLQVLAAHGTRLAVSARCGHGDARAMHRDTRRAARRPSLHATRAQPWWLSVCRRKELPAIRARFAVRTTCAARVACASRRAMRRAHAAWHMACVHRAATAIPNAAEMSRCRPSRSARPRARPRRRAARARRRSAATPITWATAAATRRTPSRASPWPASAASLRRRRHARSPRARAAPATDANAAFRRTTPGRSTSPACARAAADCIERTPWGRALEFIEEQHRHCKSTLVRVPRKRAPGARECR